MNARQQKQAKKQSKKVIKPTPTTLPIEDKSKDLERLSGIMKGIIVYKTETAELYRLMNKYPEIGYRGAQALGAYA